MADKRHKWFLILPALMVALTACDPGWNDFEMRIAWKPDSVITGSDSCIQRFYLRGNRLGEKIWCTPEAEEFMQAESQIEVILARHEWRELSQLALEVKEGGPPVQSNLSSLKESEALIWITQNNSRKGFVTSTHTDAAADSLITQLRKTLQTRRPKQGK